MQRIILDKSIKHGKPIIKGTRVPVDIILGSLAGGMSYEEICAEYEIENMDIRSAIEYFFSRFCLCLSRKPKTIFQLSLLTSGLSRV